MGRFEEVVHNAKTFVTFMYTFISRVKRKKLEDGATGTESESGAPLIGPVDMVCALSPASPSSSPRLLACFLASFLACFLF